MRLDEATVARLAAFVPARDLRAMRVVTGRPGCWLPRMFRMSAITFAPYVCFRPGSYAPESGRGLALIAHEAHHIRQSREAGRVWFYFRYVGGQFRCGFKHGRHPMESPAIEIQRRVLAAFGIRPNRKNTPRREEALSFLPSSAEEPGGTGVAVDQEP